MALGAGRFVCLFPLGCASVWRWSQGHPDGSEPRTSSGLERADTAHGAPMVAFAAGGYASCQVRTLLSERAGAHRPALLRAAPISPMTGAEAMLARLPLVVLLGGHRPHETDHPSCSGHYPSGRKKISRSIAQDFRILAKGLTHVLFWLMRIAELAEPSRSPI